MNFKYSLLYFIIACAPFILVVMVNEYFKPEKPFHVQLAGEQQVEAYNPQQCERSYCTWHCHNHGCGKLKGKYACKHEIQNVINTGLIEELYYSILKMNGLQVEADQTYRTATLTTLVVLAPLFMFIMVVLNLRLYFTIKRVRNGN